MKSIEVLRKHMNKSLKEIEEKTNKNLERNQMSLSQGMDKENVVYLHNKTFTQLLKTRTLGNLMAN